MIHKTFYVTHKNNWHNQDMFQADKKEKKIPLLGQPKVNKAKIFLFFKKFVKCSQTKFHADTMTTPKLLGQKKTKFSVRSKFSCSRFFLMFDILLKLLQSILICVCKLVAILK